MTQTNKKFTMKFAVVALAVGMLSPSISIQDNGTAEVSMFNAAEARQHVKHNVNRNVNVKHHNGGHYNNNYNNHHDDHTAAKVLGGMAVGVANEVIDPNDTALQKTVKAKAVRGDYRQNRQARR
ncbi:MAG: hypothetical protein GQ531_10785 [Sulfurovum sp.]|nr:hypothetical protein [Sulfurovum sp.]